MGSNAFFVNASPPCYGPMTYVQALALRAASGLRVGCPVIITDGPVIGVAGNTSVCRVELQPVSATEWGVEAKIDTTFASSGGEAWFGLYNVDRGTKGAIYELRDLWGNVVKDADTDAPTVHTQFPWHLGSATVRDNTIQDCTLTGFTVPLTAGVTFSNNNIANSTVVLTGVTNAAATFINNVIQDSSVTVASPNMSVRNNNLRLCTITHSGTGTFTLASDRLTSFTYAANAGTTAACSVLECNAASAFRVNVVTKTTNPFVLNRCYLNGVGAGSFEIVVGGTGDIALQGSTLTATALTLNGTGLTRVVESDLIQTTITTDTGSTAPFTVDSSHVGEATITTGAANDGAGNTFVNCNITAGTFTLNGPVASPARNDFSSILCHGLTLTVAATATAGVNLSNGYYDGGAVNQNRTAGTGATQLTSCETKGTTNITDSGTADPTTPVGLNRVRAIDTALTIGNLSAKTGAGTVLQDADLIGSTVTVTGLAGAILLNRVRTLGAVLSNAGFDGDVLELSGLTKTMTASQTNRIGNSATDNWV